MSAEALAWINAKVLQKVLKHSEGDESLEVQNVIKKPAVEKGNNFGSDMVRAVVEYSRNESGRKVIEKKSLIFKISPMADGLQKEVIEQFGAFNIEINMFEKTLPKMNEILDEKGFSFNPNALYTEIGEPSVIVMEDLSSLGYRTAARQTGLDLEHSILVMRGLAKFHATSLAIFEKDPNSMTSYKTGVFHEDNPSHLKNYFSESLRNLAYEIANWSELGSSARSCSEKLLKLSKVCYQRAAECSKPKENDFNVLNHGDAWITNLLFRYNDEGKVIDNIFVDFQVSVWSSPAVDITRFMNGNVSEEVDLHHRGLLLEVYLNVLTKTMTRLKCKTKHPSMADLEKMLMDHEILTILSTIVGFRMLLINKNEVNTIDHLLGHSEGYVEQTFKGQVFRRRVHGRLLDWYTRGVLDV